MQQPKRLWTSQQLDYIGTCYRATADLSAIAARLLLDYGIQRTPGQIRAAINRNGLTSGRDTTFRPGARPWNAGLKGRNGTSNTTFKPGNCPPNRQPLGHLRTGRGGYQEIKVAEPNPYTGHATRYRALHVLRWEQAHGRSVPPGHCVIFIDGDPAHCDPDNLCLVERAELLRINHNGHADLPKELRPQAITLARVQTAISRAARPRNHAAEPDHVPG